MRARNPYALDPRGYRGPGLYNFWNPHRSFAASVAFADRQDDGLIALREEEGGIAEACLTDDQFRAARDWPLSIGKGLYQLGTGSVVRVRAH